MWSNTHLLFQHNYWLWTRLHGSLKFVISNKIEFKYMLALGGYIFVDMKSVTHPQMLPFEMLFVWHYLYDQLWLHFPVIVGKFELCSPKQQNVVSNTRVHDPLHLDLHPIIQKGQHYKKIKSSWKPWNENLAKIFFQ